MNVKRIHSDSKITKVMKSSDDSLSAFLPNFLIDDLKQVDSENSSKIEKEIIEADPESTYFESLEDKNDIDLFKPFCFMKVLKNIILIINHLETLFAQKSENAKRSSSLKW